MNIMGLAEHDLVTLLPAHLYLYDCAETTYAAAEQCGVYHRPMVGIRFYDVPAAKVLAMHRYFEWLLSRQHAENIGFGLLASVMRNVRRSFLSVAGRQQLVEEGNCARFASKGLLETGLLLRDR